MTVSAVNWRRGRKAIDLQGQVFGRLRVLGRLPAAKRAYACWACQCDCGNLVQAHSRQLRDGDFKSCGCLRTGPRPDVQRQEGYNYPRALIERAIELHDSGLTWAVVAERLDRERKSLMREVTRFRKGKMLFTAEKRDQQSAEIIELIVTKRASVREAARIFGLHHWTVHKRLLDKGMDREMIREERKLRGLPCSNTKSFSAAC